jgi:predicted nucleic acid-binding Zn ribbon protein
MERDLVMKGSTTVVRDSRKEEQKQREEESALTVCATFL